MRYHRRDNLLERVGPRSLWWLMLWVAALVCVGCGDRIQLPSAERLLEFEQAGPVGPTVDVDRIVKAKMQKGPYRVVIGDVIQLEMPSMLFPDGPDSGAVAAAPGGRITHTCRVDDAGLVTLPDGRQIDVAGKSLGQIEAAVVTAYYPDLVRIRPAVYAQVLEYRTLRVQIMGSVMRPGIYLLRHDQMSLVSLLMEAGGISDEGAAMIHITRSEGATMASEQRVMASRKPERRSISSRSDGVRPAVLFGGQRQDSRSNIAPEACATFEREGPLATTGWLTVDVGNVRIVRQWLDIDSAVQRKTVLGRVAAQTSEIAVEELDAKLLELAGFLSSRGVKELVVATPQPSRRWAVQRGSHFTTPLQSPARVRNVVSRVDLLASEGVVSDQPMAVSGSESEADVTLALPVRGLDIPLVDVSLQEGDSVVIERPRVQYVSILGLVREPGNLPYVPNSEHTLAEALASAGGLDLVADPRYVSIYRLRANGTVASVTYQLIDPDQQEQLTEALALKLKPGDVVSVENTPRTRANTFFNTIFRISLGLYYDPSDLWGSDG